MGDLAIRAAGLGKRFRLHHEVTAGGYRTLREDFTQLPRRVWSMIRSARDEEFWALKDVSFEVKEGEIVGVIGRNGSGKSTLLKILSRITPPTIGEVDLFGRVGSLLEVGTGFHPELTGRENIFLSGALLGMKRPEIRRRFDEIVEFSGVEKFLDTPCKHYSSGMFLRLGFAVAAHLDAEILLVDEVLAVGDAEFQRKCLGKMGAVAESGRAVLFVSHNLDAVRKVCASAVLFENGRAGIIEAVDTVVNRYLEDTCRLIGDLNVSGMAIDRSAAGVVLRSIRIFGKGTGPVTTGERLLVEVEYETTSDYDGWDAGLVFRVMLPSSQEIMRLSTEPISGFHLGRLGASGTIRLVLESLPLCSGVYFIGLGLSKPNTELLLDLSPVGRVMVLGADVYSSGYIPKSDRGLMVTAHHWEHDSRRCNLTTTRK